MVKEILLYALPGSAMLYGIETEHFFQGSLWLYILEGTAYHLEKVSCIVKIIL